ncbi:hypothetical protein BofuT4_uP116880.1 [Botrytis cinerea T4]|uniref:Uncharacterized protein n=1 Tax=Botryotinia fuckeliana (strain T4) TaxID=999810 RepID=G2Y0H3_BOTF4|nr:hypothetical protein BofuT4_uP116880.1 [Botrytis cinerea T4]
MRENGKRPFLSGQILSIDWVTLPPTGQSSGPSPLPTPPTPSRHNLSPCTNRNNCA